MKTYTFKAILQETGWKENVGINVDEEGKITDIKFSVIYSLFQRCKYERVHYCARKTGLSQK